MRGLYPDPPYTVAVRKWDEVADRAVEPATYFQIAKGSGKGWTAKPAISAEVLIKDLDEEATRHKVVAIVVAFENTSVFIYSHDLARVDNLSDALRVSGVPVGLVAFDEVDVQPHSPGEPYQGRLCISSSYYPWHGVDAAERYGDFLGKLAHEWGTGVTKWLQDTE